MIGRKEFQKRFPDAAMTDFAAPSDLNAESGLFWANRDAVRVCEYWVKRPVERTIARLASGETLDITDIDASATPAVIPASTVKLASTVIPAPHRHSQSGNPW